MATLGGLIYFREYTQLDRLTAPLFASGLALSISCVAALTTYRVRRDGIGDTRLQARPLMDVVDPVEPGRQLQLQTESDQAVAPP